MIKGGSPYDNARKSRLAKFSRVSSLVFELELEESGHRDEHDNGADGAVQELQSLAQPWSDVEYKLLHCVRMAKDEAGRAPGAAPLDPARLAERLRASGFDVKLCSALGGGAGGECLRNLRHTFLSVTAAPGAVASVLCSGGGGGALHQQQHHRHHHQPRFIVDLHFKEQFEIAQPTERYARLLGALPTEFVGSEDRATLLVTFLCREIADAFRAQGHTLPPWRQPDSMLSKWRPRRSVECDVPPPAAQEEQQQQQHGAQAAVVTAQPPAALYQSSSHLLPPPASRMHAGHAPSDGSSLGAARTPRSSMGAARASFGMVAPRLRA